MRVYLPPYQTCTVYHLKDLCDGTKTQIACDDVKIIFIPQYEHMGIDDIIGYGN